MPKIDFLPILYQSPRYFEALEVRRDVLRRPWGRDYSEADIAADAEGIHIVAIADECVAGCVILFPSVPHEMKVRQMAVAEAHQNQGIGAGLMQVCEATAIARGITSLHLNARISAAGFYERLGYQPQGEPFLLIDIPHILMTKSL